MECSGGQYVLAWPVRRHILGHNSKDGEVGIHFESRADGTWRWIWGVGWVKEGGTQGLNSGLSKIGEYDVIN